MCSDVGRHVVAEDGPSSQVDSGFAEVGHDDVTEPPQDNVFDEDDQVSVWLSVCEAQRSSRVSVCGGACTVWAHKQ